LIYIIKSLDNNDHNNYYYNDMIIIVIIIIIIIIFKTDVPKEDHIQNVLNRIVISKTYGAKPDTQAKINKIYNKE